VCARSARVGWIAGQLIALRQERGGRTRWVIPAASAVGGRSKDKGTASAEALEFAAYFLVWTTLSAAFPAAAILDLYAALADLNWCLSA